MREKSIVVEYDVFYIAADDPSGLKPGWYFWFIDQKKQIVSEPIGPFADVEDVMRSGQVAVNVIMTMTTKRDRSVALLTN